MLPRVNFFFSHLTWKLSFLASSTQFKRKCRILGLFGKHTMWLFHHSVESMFFDLCFISQLLELSVLFLWLHSPLNFHWRTSFGPSRTFLNFFAKSTHEHRSSRSLWPSDWHKISPILLDSTDCRASRQASGSVYKSNMLAWKHRKFSQFYRRKLHRKWCSVFFVRRGAGPSFEYKFLIYSSVHIFKY